MFDTVWLLNFKSACLVTKHFPFAQGFYLSYTYIPHSSVRMSWHEEQPLWEKNTCCKVDNDSYLLIFLVPCGFYGGHNPYTFISILYGMLIITDLSDNRRQVVFGQPGILLLVGVHVKGSMRPSHWKNSGI